MRAIISKVCCAAVSACLLVACTGCGAASAGAGSAPAVSAPAVSAPAVSAPAVSSPAASTPAASSEAVASSAAQTPTQADVLGAPLPYGQSVRADLDGDGTDEELFVTIDPDDMDQPLTSLSVNGVDYAAGLPAQNVWIYFPSEKGFYLTDLDTADGVQELAFEDNGPSDDPSTTFFHYENGQLVPIGTIPAHVSDKYTALDGHGGLEANARLGLFQTWFAPMRWKLADDAVTLDPQPLYTPYYPCYDGQTATLTLPIMVYSAMDKTSASTLWQPSAEAVSFPATDNLHWVEVQRGSESGWIYLDDFSEMEGESGTVSSYDAFDGLFLAD